MGRSYARWGGGAILPLVLGCLGLLLVAGVSSGRESSSVCGSVDGGAGARITANVAGVRVRAVVDGRLGSHGSQPCALTVRISVPASDYSVAFKLRWGRAVLAQRTLRISRAGAVRVVLALDKSARDELQHATKLSATLRMVASSSQAKTGSATTKLVLQPRLQSVTFQETGKQQRFVVPAGVRSISVRAVGAPGETGSYAIRSAGGYGAIVSGVLAVHPGEVLYVEVGGMPHIPDQAFGGFNGGGNAGRAYTCETAGCGPAGGGGGASDIRTISMSASGSLGSRLLVAGGGGGGGNAEGSGTGGAGGNASAAGSAGKPSGGAGGLPGMGSGGAGGAASGNAAPGDAGALGIGGSGGEGAPSTAQNTGGDGGGGGGGVFGGGGGGGGGNATPNGSGGGGGGGTSLVPPGGSSRIAPCSPEIATCNWLPMIEITYAM